MSSDACNNGCKLSTDECVEDTSFNGDTTCSTLSSDACNNGCKLKCVLDSTNNCDTTTCTGCTTEETCSDPCVWDATSNKCNIAVNKCGIGCLSCNGDVCLKCEEGYNLSGNECLCPNSCDTCSPGNVCTSCHTEAGLMLEFGECVSCFKKNPGCKECNSTTGSCISCLDNFKTDEEGKCDSTKNAKKPTFKPVGLGRFYRIEKGKTIYFRLYLRVTSGIMFNCKIKFTLVVTKERRSLESYETEGTCEQIGTVTCSENENPSVADCTGMLDCEGYLENDYATYSKLQAKDFKLEEVNKQNMNDEKVDANGLSEMILNKQTGTDFEKKTKIFKKFYAFNQIVRSSCKCKNGITNLKLKGSVAGYNKDIINNEYSFNTTEGEASCILVKEGGYSDATFNCTVPTSSKTFNFVDYESPNFNGDTYSLAALEMNSGKSVCSIEDDSSSKNSSSSGLSGGAIAGIVVGSVVIVIAAGAIIAFFAISTKAAGIAAGVAAAQSAASSSQTGFVVSPTTTSGNIAA